MSPRLHSSSSHLSITFTFIHPPLSPPLPFACFSNFLLCSVPPTTPFSILLYLCSLLPPLPVGRAMMLSSWPPSLPPMLLITSIGESSPRRISCLSSPHTPSPLSCMLSHLHFGRRIMMIQLDAACVPSKGQIKNKISKSVNDMRNADKQSLILHFISTLLGVFQCGFLPKSGFCTFSLVF